ncbi:MAG TPA: hypothetical protein VNJ28_07120, partial [Candidatus Limnocylindrales bacterium]|nr:hypothetical protein [Candidatus Limnocylindrales bacterium]
GSRREIFRASPEEPRELWAEVSRGRWAVLAGQPWLLALSATASGGRARADVLDVETGEIRPGAVELVLE